MTSTLRNMCEQAHAHTQIYTETQTHMHMRDVGFPSVCYEYVLLLLVIKEAVSANGLVE